MVTRIIAGFIVACAAVYLILLQNFLVVVAVSCALIFLGYLEFLVITKTLRYSWLRYLAALMAPLTLLQFNLGWMPIDGWLWFSTLFSILGILVLISLLHHSVDEQNIIQTLLDRFSHFIFVLGGQYYVFNIFGYLPLIANRPNGHYWLLTALGSIFMGDTGAYFVGKNFGKRKLYPLLSPNKTVEGSMGGVLASVTVGLSMSHFLIGQKIDVVLVIAFIFLAILAQAGDLFESLIKRACQVKDSGKIMPGHGGILDRCDGLTFVMPFFYWFLQWLS